MENKIMTTKDGINFALKLNILLAEKENCKPRCFTEVPLNKLFDCEDDDSY